MFLVLSLVPIIVLNFPFSCLLCSPLSVPHSLVLLLFLVYFLFYFEGPHVVFCAFSSLWSFLSHQWLIEFTYSCSVISLCLFLKSLSVYHRYTLFFTESSLVMDFVVFISLNLNHAARFVYFLFYKNPMNASARTLESGYFATQTGAARDQPTNLPFSHPQSIWWSPTPLFSHSWGRFNDT